MEIGEPYKNTMSSNSTNKHFAEPTLWSTYHDIKAVLEAPAIEKRQVQVLVDDSNRIVDMTLIKPNLYIGDELVSFLCYKYIYVMRIHLEYKQYIHC